MSTDSKNSVRLCISDTEIYLFYKLHDTVR